MKYATLQRCRMAGVAAFALSIVVIAGCGGGDSSGGSTTPPPVLQTINGVVIQSVSPSTVPLTAGQVVTVTGTGFQAKDASGNIMDVTVQLGHTTVNSTVTSDTTLTLVTPAAPHGGVVDVRVINAKGISAITASDVLTFVDTSSTGTTTGTTTTGTTTTGTTTTGTTTTGTTTTGSTSGGPPGIPF